MTLLLILTLFHADPLVLNPKRDFWTLDIPVSPTQPVLLVFNTEPDPNLVIGNPKDWYITTPGESLPGNALHAKPRSDAEGLETNLHLFFDGWPVEILLTSDPSATRGTVRITIEGLDRSETLAFNPRGPEVRAASAPSSTPRTTFRGPSRERRGPWGRVRYAFAPTPSLVLEIAEGMADLTSVEIVRGRSPWWRRAVVSDQPIPSSVRHQDGNLHWIEWQRTHLGKGERYYLRLMFEGARQPVWVRLRP